MSSAGIIAASGGIVLPSIGSPFYQGYFAGVIDTTRTGSIQSGDDYTTGARYALIVSPKSMEINETSGSGYYYSSYQVSISGTKTRWNGLGATQAMDAAYHTFQSIGTYCLGLSYTTDGGSSWYLPAYDELQLIAYNLKPDTSNNYVGQMPATSGPFNGTSATNTIGYNPSSSPPGVAWTATSPSQTSVSIFQGNGAQQLSGAYIVSTEEDSSDVMAMWINSSQDGLMTQHYKNYNTGGFLVRPVRRLLLT
jgi:hypothetical protein